MANIKDKTPTDKNGKKHGEWIRYYDNGQLMYRSNWIHGTRHGLCEGYTSRGKLEYRGYYNMGRKIDYWLNGFIFSKKYYLCLI